MSGPRCPHQVATARSRPGSRVRVPPFRFAPQDGEGLDSWLLAFGHFVQALPGDILDAAVIGESRTRGLTPRAIALGPDVIDLDSLARVANIEGTSLRACVDRLATYQARISASPVLRSLRMASVSASSQACPACLAQSGGRWAAAWRVGLVPACPEHGTWLIATCPSCAAPLRRRMVRVDQAPRDPVVCDAPVGSLGRRPKLCGASLVNAEAQEAPVSVVELSRLISGLFDCAEPKGAVALASDWSVLTAAAPTQESLAAIKHRAFAADPASRLALAVAADAILSSNLEAFATYDDDGSRKNLRGLPTRLAHISEALVPEVLDRRRARMKPTEQLRWRTWGQPARPTSQKSNRYTRTPASLWPEVSLGLLPRSLPTHGIFRRSCAALLQVPGSTRPLQELAKSLQHVRVSGAEVSHVARHLAATPEGSAALKCLADISEQLDRGRCPIDYERRRSIPLGPDLLADAEWKGIARASRMAVGDARRLTHARIWMWETLTGSEFDPAWVSAEFGATDISLTYPSFHRNLTADAADGLREAGEAFLRRVGISGEPLEWMPDFQSQTIMDAETRQRIRGAVTSGAAPGDVADQEGLTFEHVKLIMRITHASTRAARPSLTLAAIPPEVISEMLVGRSLTLRQAAAELGVDRKTLSRHCRIAGIDYQAPGRRKTWHVDPEWLRQQYVDLGRPMPDIAREIGCSPAQVARLAREFSIPLRDRGGRSHASATRPADVPGGVLPLALRGQGGEQRVRRFLVVAESRSMNDAAQRMGINPVTVLSQLRRTEQAVGGQLIERATKSHAAHTFTALGRELVEEAVLHFGLSSRPQIPEPLASALSIFRAPERLERLSVLLFGHPLREAARQAGTDPGTFARSVRDFERAWGFPLISGAMARSEPVDLTPQGELLLRQWSDLGTTVVSEIHRRAAV